MSYTVQCSTQPQTRIDWDDRIAADGHVLQSWAWGELKARFGWSAQRISAGTACAQVLYRTLPMGLGTIAYMPKGPVARDVPTLQTLLNAIRPLAKQRGAVCLKIEPDWENDPVLGQQLRELGFRISPQQVQPRRTILVDLGPEPEMLKRMKQKTRYNIRVAERKGVTVRSGDEADLPSFYGLMQSTAARDGFGIHSQAYYETAHRLFVPWGMGRLLLAEYDGQMLAALMVFAFGQTACYMYGASSDQHRNLMPTYLLQWEAMRWAIEQGCRTYDLWGVPDEDEDVLEANFPQRNDGLWGVYRFKRGFGGRVVRTIGAWDLAYAPARYQLYSLAVRWLKRRTPD